MPQTLGGLDLDRLERSCNQQGDSTRFGPHAPGIERAEVHLCTCAFEPHRHDTYAIGITIAGVQTFRYGGTKRVSLPGQLQILYPDETHDGAAGTDDGFGYRVLYIAPELIRDALDSGSLPFVADPVQKPSRVTRLLVSLLAEVDEPVSDLARAEIAVTIADTLRTLSGSAEADSLNFDLRSVEIARDYLVANARDHTPASVLENITGADRFTLARHFRRAYGTSPDRYRTLRRLALARTGIERGQPLVDAAVEAGFSDQSHMTRQFRRTYGFTPARWRALTSAA